MNQPHEAEVLDRLPPHSIEAEMGVLGCLILDPSLYESVTELRREDFYVDRHGVIYQTIAGLMDAGKAMDVTLLVERLKADGTLEYAGGMSYLAELAKSVAVSAHAPHYAQVVIKHSRARNLINVATTALSNVYAHQDPDDVLEFVESSLSQVQTRTDVGRPISCRAAAIEASLEIDRRMQAGTFGGLPTGIPALDEFTGGFFPGEVTVVAAATGSGKTSLALQAAAHNAARGRTVYFVSMEMRHTELSTRLACAESGVNGHDVRLGRLNSEDFHRLSLAFGQQSDTLMIHPPGPVNVHGLAREARRLARKDLALVVVDYIGLIHAVSSKKEQTRQDDVAGISHALKDLARTLDVPVLVLSQFNRNVVDNHYKPRLTELKESSAIEQDADVVWFIRRKERKEEKTEFNSVLDVMKCRNGETGPVHLEWVPRWTKFVDQIHPEFDPPTEYGI